MTQLRSQKGFAVLVVLCPCTSDGMCYNRCDPSPVLHVCPISGTWPDTRLLAGEPLSCLQVNNLFDNSSPTVLTPTATIKSVHLVWLSNRIECASLVHSRTLYWAAFNLQANNKVLDSKQQLTTYVMAIKAQLSVVLTLLLR